MANKIGIVLALDGEQKFTQAMRNAQQSTKTLKTNLTNLSKEFEGTANTMEALRSKQSALKSLQEAYARSLATAKAGQDQAKKKYQDQAKALEKLRKEYEQAQKALDQMEREGKQNTAEYQKQKAQVEKLSKAVDKQTANYLKAEGRLAAWDAKVEQAEADVRKNNAALEENAKYLEEASQSADGCAKSIDAMGKEASEASGELDSGGQSLKDFLMFTAANLAATAIREVGKAAVEAAKYIVQVGMNFESAMSKVEALSGASTAELTEMESVAKQLGSTTRFSATEVAEGFSYMALAGWDASSSIAAMPGIVNLAAASQMDLAEASDMVTDYLSAFGMEAKDATNMADMMAYAQANSNTSTTQLGDAFGNCAANMHAAGQDMQTTTAFLAAFANQGVKGAEAGTKLSAIMRDITAKMQDGKIMIGDTAVEVMDASGNFRDLTDIMVDVEAATAGMGNAERSAALAATFTSRSIGGLNMILTEGVGNIASFEENLNSCDGTADNMAKTMNDNLAGKVTEFNSALEGLGIELYGYFSGPLSGAIGLATDLIQGITKVLAPQKTELEKFSDSVMQANKEVQQSLEHANQTITNGEQKAAQIGAFGEEIQNVMEACEQYNLISLDDGTQKIVDSTGQVLIGFREIDGQVEITESALGGFNSVTLEDGTKQITDKVGTVVAAFQEVDGQLVVTEGAFAGFTGEELADGTTVIKDQTGKVVLAFQDIDGQVTITEGALAGFDTKGMSVDQIVASALTAQQAIGYITTDAETVESRLQNFAKKGINTAEIQSGSTAIIELFDAAGQKVGEVEAQISESGNIQIPTEGLGVEAGTDAIITCFDGATGAVGSFKTSVQDLQNSQDLNISNISEQFGTVEDAVRKTYVITDAYTKMKINTFVNTFGSSIRGLSSAWDSNTGSLKASREELENWFSVAREVTLYQAYKDAAQELENSLVDAYVHVTEAESGVTNALAEYNKEHGTAFKNYQEFSDWVNTHGGWGDSQYREIQLANEALIGAQENVEECTKAVETTGKAYEEAAEAVSGMGVVIDEATGEIRLAGEESEATGEAIGTVGDKAEETTEQISAYAAAVGDMAEKTQSAYDNAKTAVTSYFESAKEAAKNGFNINPFESWTENAEHGLAAMQSAFDGQIAAMSRYSTNLQIVSQHVGKEITPQFLKYLMDLGEDGAQAMMELADALSTGDTAKVEELMQSYEEAMNVQEEIANITAANALAFALGMDEFGSTPDEWNTVRTNIEKFSSTVDQTLQDDLETALKTAEMLGIKIPDELAASIENGSADPTQAVVDITNMLNQAIEGHVAGLAEAAAAAGATLPENFAERIAQGGATAQQAWNELIGSLTGEETTSAAAQAGSDTGEQVGSSVAEGIESQEETATSAAQGIVDSAKEAAATAAGTFAMAGSAAALSFAAGMALMQFSVTSAGQALGNAGKSGAEGADFTSAGSTAASNFASGIRNGASEAVSAAGSMASAAQSAASSWSDSFYSVGVAMMQGMQAGINAAAGQVANAAAGAAKAALQASKNAVGIQSPSKAFRDEVGKNISKGTALGIKQSTGLVQDAAEAQMNQTLAALQKWINKNKKKIAKTGTSISEATTYGWQALADVELQKGFGISKKKESGSGDKKKTEKKSAEEYAREVYQAARQYIENVDTLFGASDEEQLKYWEKVRKHLKRGTQAWYDATEQIKNLRQKQAEEEQEAQRQQAAAAAEAEREILENARKNMEHMKILGDVSLDDQIKYWVNIRKSLKKGSDEWYEATAEINSLQKQQRDEQAQTYSDILKSANDYVSQQKSLNRMSIREEEQYWIEIRKRLKKGTDEYKEATQRIAEARLKIGTVDTAEGLLDAYQVYFDTSAKAEMQYWYEVRKHYKKGTEERLQADKNYYAARKKYLESFEKLREQYADDRASVIKERDDAIASAEEKLAERIRTINEDLARDIERVNEDRISQITALQDKYYDAVRSRKEEIMGAFDIFGAFESQSATGKELLFNMQAQAAGYKDWAKSLEQLRKRGILSEGLMSEISAKGPQDSAAVHALLQLSDAQLKAYNAAYAEREKVAQAQAEKENKALLTETAKQIADVKQAAKDEIARLRAEAKQQRKEATDSTNAEIKALKSEASKKLADLKQTYTTERTALGKSIDSSLLELAKNIRKTAGDETAKIVSAITTSFDTVKVTKSSGSNSAYHNLLKAPGFASGSKYIDEFFAWMDELGIGSEMIVRKDGARLNTNVRPGDMIISAANTDNLWDWSRISPTELLQNLDKQQLALSQYVAAVTSGVASMAALNNRVMSADVVTGGGNNAMAGLMSVMLGLMEEYMPYIAQQRTLSVDGRELAGATADYMSTELAMRARRRNG